jgi:hypothetical protein
MIQIKNNNAPVIDFSKGMPEKSYDATTSKTSNGKGGGDELSANNKTLYKTLRVAVNDHTSGVEWSIDACDGYSEDGTGWRLPTQRELQAIWILQSEIKNKLSTFALLTDDYYWSATDAIQTSGTHAWTIFGSRTGDAGNAPNQPKSTHLHVRCVREVNP